MRGRRWVAAAGAVGALAGAGAAIGTARGGDARPAAPAGGLALSPALVQHPATAGAVETVTVANHGRTRTDVTVAVRPWLQSVSGVAVPDRRATARGIAVSDAAFSLAAGASRRVTVTSSRAGAAYVALEVVGLPARAAARDGVVTGSRLVGALRYTPALPVHRLAAGAAEVTGGALTLSVRNAGNTVDPVSGSVRLKGPLGTRHGGIRALRILPGRRVDLGLGSTRALGRGAYTATITLRQAGERTTLTRRFRVRG